MTDIVLFLSQLKANVFRTNTSKLVWFCLMRDVDDAGMVKTSALSIAKEIGVNEKTVRKVFDNLVKEGLIDTICPILSPNDSPKKVRYMGRVIKLNGLDICGISKKAQVRKKSDISSDIQSDIPQGALKPAHDGFERFRYYFNNAVAGTTIPQIAKLTDARKNALRSIFKEYGRETVETVIHKVIGSDFLTRGWGKVSFDWIFKKSNFIKILEGNYDNRTRPIASTDTPAARKASRDRLHRLATGVVSQSADKLLSLYDGVYSNPDTRAD